MADSLAELNPVGPAPDNRDLTFGRYLDRWIANKADLKASTRRGYEKHIRLYLKPGLGHIRLAELRDDHFDELYRAIRQIGRPLKGQRPSFLLLRLLEVRRDDPARRRPLGAATLARIHATARGALNDAVARPSLPIRVNPSVYAERPKPRRRHALLWTAPRVAAWERTGRVPSPVMVWTPAQSGAFLDFAAADRLYPLWHLVAHRGPRRGETVALGWAEVDLAAATAFIRENDTGEDDEFDLDDEDDYDQTKSRAGDRLITLDRATVTALRIWRLHQNTEHAAAGERWVDSGRVFTHPDGRPLTPDGVSQRFERLVARYSTVRREHAERDWDADYLARRHRMPATSIQAALDHGPLPPIRFHDLRHNAASLTYHATHDMKAVSALLGHASIQITGDIYTTLFEEADRAAAEAAARLVPRTNLPAGWDDPEDPGAETDTPEAEDPDLGL
ncbi:tyrosine-type recombinase/integrase [Pseudofrankia sp. BMG5.37]|uniref:site-specific integrase n=1 Tax=Pseudofrankia sp. BMG5.37 TaxID=3050035 RepID=UPI0028958CC5|nr:tyrosine-type recombinase/integrase [Pseudofrankia sp. BMG5.37]MDT3442697.1 tyrosine-type recombinase/integrase [Pseudofrankia sp. BMG5.37]